MGLLERLAKVEAEKARNEGRIEAVVRDAQGRVIVNPFVMAARQGRLPVQRLAPLTEGK